MKTSNCVKSNSVGKKRARQLSRALKKLFPNPKMALLYSNNWELLVAVVLSAQCTDKIVNKITAALFKKYKMFDDYVKANKRVFEKDIRPAGFYRNKAKNILASAKIIRKKHHGKVPDTMDELLQLPGVARKTANIILGNAFGKIEGIAVDTHVKRLSRRFGLTKENNPEKIEKDLMALFPQSEWLTLSCRLIEYGRKYCSVRICPSKHPLRKYDISNTIIGGLK